MEGDRAGPWSLPDGLLLHALLTLPLKEFLACARVCKRWLRLSKSLHSQAVYPLIDRRLAKIGAKAAAPARLGTTGGVGCVRAVVLGAGDQASYVGDGELLFAGDDDADYPRVRAFWVTNDGSGVPILPAIKAAGTVHALAVSTAGDRLYIATGAGPFDGVGAAGNTIQVWSVADGLFTHAKTLNPEGAPGHPSPVFSLALAEPASGGTAPASTGPSTAADTTSTASAGPGPERHRLYAGSMDHTISVWLDSGGLHSTLVGHTGAVNALVTTRGGSTDIISPNFKLYSGSADATIRVWSADGKHLQTLSSHTGDIMSLAVSRDGTLLCSGSSDKTVKTWSTATDLMSIRHTLTGHRRTVYSLALSPDASLLYTGSSDKTLRVWSTVTGSQVERCRAGEIYSLKMASDGKRLYSGSDSDIKSW